ncbi:DUF6934 family protein [Chryseobacterium luteum]|uniref:Uncharacterized protein n=1 Tax=Chryseobacterium luteum TaxID=421531 RepID=A0A085ZTT5_9FLAO|nr:hypothetical protein [Chryseobacterium luteum]KFF07849.1 hypothetical protein IX38_09125 [Chryseobacterium luteum]
MIKINLEDTYEPISISDDLTEFIFHSELNSGESKDLYVRFYDYEDPFLPNVYNLAYGPLDEHGKIDDTIKLQHKNINKLFSTIIFFVITFLDTNKDKKIGIDGSDDTRAYLYHRMFISNHEELNDLVVIIGVDWYVKLLRNGNVERDQYDRALFKPRPEPFDLERKASNLYRYYLIERK